MTFFEERIQKEIDSDNARRKKNTEEHGWKFDSREKRLLRRTVMDHTIGDFIRAVMAIDVEAGARRFYEGYVAMLRTCTPNPQGASSEEVARANIGWCFGEGMAPERVAMWRNVCGAAHPIFGAMAVAPTPEEAFEAGRKRAKEEPWPT